MPAILAVVLETEVEVRCAAHLQRLQLCRLHHIIIIDLLFTLSYRLSMMLDQTGKSTDLLVRGRLPQCVCSWVHRFVEDTMVSLRVNLQRALKLPCSHPLLLYERAEDGKLYHVAQVELRCPCLKVQFHSNLLHLEVAEELALGCRLADQCVDGVNEADH